VQYRNRRRLHPQLSMKERWMSTSPKVKPWHGDGGKGCCVKNKKECTKGNTMMTEDNPFFFPQVDSSSLLFLSPLHLLPPLFFLLFLIFNSTLLFSQNTHSSSIPTLLDTHSPTELTQIIPSPRSLIHIPQ